MMLVTPIGPMQRRTNEMEITRMQVLGTVHMSPRTALHWIPRCPWACFQKGDYGWFMYVCDDVGVTEAVDVPPEIRSAIHVAKREGCGWIMWDSDGPVIDEQPE
ncbi:hypothetical protein [Novosphingobium sp. TCA1]|uniref:DUF5983 family protein n=1 Tax=Novosphingobium sp. TCA1 TaxID=2682474 RepID=UPI00135800DF|nr:hypothetical protein [Novosphingobium sp. TCA1]